jgi:hypothetical protein
MDFLNSEQSRDNQGTIKGQSRDNQGKIKGHSVPRQPTVFGKFKEN